MKNITIYSTPTCTYCNMVKAFFKEKNLAYTEHDVAKDLGARKEMIEKSGQMGVPVIIAGDQVIVGFDKARLSQALGVN